MAESILIIGGTRGIGRLLADHFIHKQDEVTIAARSQRDLQDREKAYREQKVQVHTSVTDITSSDQVERCFDSHYSAWGRMPSVVINAAAIQGPIGPICDVLPQEWEKTLSINLLGSFYVARASIRAMKDSSHGSIIMFSGGGAAYARPNFSAYGVAKTGVLRLVETAAEEMQQAGYGHIIINAIAPGAVRTRMTEEVLQASDQAGDKALKEAQDIMQTGGTPTQLIIDLIDFLTDKEQHRGLTGRLIHVREDYRQFVTGGKGASAPEAGKLRRIPLE